MLLPGVTAEQVVTGKLPVSVLRTERTDGEAVLFVHGNVSSSVFWEAQLLALPPEYRPLAIDLRGFGGTPARPVDATRGLRDFADDVTAALDQLQVERAHLVGWSMGAGVVLQVMLDRPALARSVTLVAPISPYGFGGTTGPGGALISPDGAGSGAGGANPQFVSLLAAGDTTADQQASPRSVFRAFYVADGFRDGHEDRYVASMLTTHIGTHNYPGDMRPSQAWPGAAPGQWGVLNALAPTVCNLAGIVEAESKPPILWVRGDQDLIVSDDSMFDLAALGKLGVVPDWPGELTHAPQPMLAQTRAVLERYTAAGGSYREVVLPGVGHSPHIEAPDRFARELAAHLGSPAGQPRG